MTQNGFATVPTLSFDFLMQELELGVTF